jgi:hypothetical protein
LTLGIYATFPENIHHLAHYQSFASVKQVQKTILQFLGDINRKELAFEQISIPTIPDGIVIFEFGLAEEAGFDYLSIEEVNRALDFLDQKDSDVLDFFCSIRYYRDTGAKRVALKFDYYMIRAVFARGSLELKVFHERGPRYLSPEDIASFIIKGANSVANKKIIRELNA